MDMKYELGLYEHNATGYEKSKVMLAEENMACAIHATGTGKTFIELQLIYDYIKEKNNKRILYVTPLNGIKDQVKEYIKNSNVPDDYFDNVEFLTYDALLNMTEEELHNIGFVVFDEFHHIKAPRYYEKIKLMMELNKDMKIFGMSATSIRGLGTSKEEDVSMTFFKGNIASVYDLADAIVDGVLPAPNYHANLLYLIDSEISDMEEKLKTGNLSFEEKTAYLNDLNKMRQRLASSDEAKDMIRKHVKADGKYLYFAQRGSDIEQIKQDFLDSIPIEFRDNVEFYQVHSSLYSKQQNKLNADCFYNNISKDTSRYEIINGQKVLLGNSNKHKLRVMISIDMYNEGIHIPDLDGVIMGRNTKSDIVFFQQLGRALAVKMKENYNPLVLDLAGNIREIIKLYKSVRKKGQSRAFPQNTTASDNYFRNIFGISQEVIDIIEELDGLKERFISKNDLIDRINYIYDNYKEKDLPKQKSTDKFPDGTKIGKFLQNNKDSIFALANIGNQKALWIIQQLDERRKLTNEEKEKQLIDRINYIYDTYKEKKIPTYDSLDRFPDDTLIGSFLQKKKDKIIELANAGNQKALWIIQQLNEKRNFTDEEKEKQLIDRINYIYDTYKEKKLPTQESTDIFPDGTLTGNFLWRKNNKDNILALANIGNQKASWIIQKLDERRKLTDDEKDKQLKERIDYLYDTYKEKGLPKQRSTDIFPDGNKIGTFLAKENNKDSILTLANNGNQKALWIIQQLNERRNLTDEEKEKQLIDRINYIYNTYKDKKIPTGDYLDKFPDGTLIRIFLQKSKDKIIELATAGNQKAMWICQQKKWIKIIEAKQEFEESSSFKELKDNLDDKNKNGNKNLS